MVYTVSKHFSNFGLFWGAHNPRHIDSADIFCGIANLRHLLLIGLLTLILPGEVKVHLANFDVKFRTKFLYTGFFQNWLIPAETSCKSFWTSDMTSKNDVLMSILTFFHQKFCRGGTSLTFPFQPVLLSLQTTWTWEKSRRAWVRSVVQRQSTFQSVSGPGLRRVWGGGRFSVGPVSRSF
jgi:hypothetical protein